MNVIIKDKTFYFEQFEITEEMTTDESIEVNKRYEKNVVERYEIVFVDNTKLGEIQDIGNLELHQVKQIIIHLK